MDQNPDRQQLWVFELCSVGGVPFGIHYTMVLLLFIQLFATTLSFHNNAYNALVITLYGPVLFITVLIHELGHVITTRCMGGVVDRIVLWPLGGFTVFGIPNGAVFDELGISFSGPITHIFQGGLWAGIYSVIHNGDFSNFSAVILLEQFRYIDAVRFISILSSQAFFINLGIFFFNLFIPAYPLDGGRVLAALLVMGKFKLDTAARITAATGILIGLILLFIGIFLYVIYTSAGALFVAVIAGFVISSGTRLWQAAASRRLHEHPLFHLDCYRNLSNNSRRSLTNSTNASRGLPISNSAHVV